MADESKPARDVTDVERADYERDGAVVLRGILQLGWIERMRRAVDRVVAAPGEAAVEYSQGDSGRYLGDFFVWMRDADFRAFALTSPLRHIAAQMMGSQSVTFFYDQLLVKEPLTPEETPWHQDLPYWPLRGADILSLWVAFDAVAPEAGAMRYVRGSQKAGVMYAPRAFSKNSGYEAIYAAMDLPPFPDLGDLDHRDDILICPVEPGDVIVHHPLTFHWSPGNMSVAGRRRALALRYIGDDAVFDARPGTFVENNKIKAVLKEPIAYRDGDRIGGANFPRVL